jgi:hypothetical protein
MHTTKASKESLGLGTYLSGRASATLVLLPRPRELLHPPKPCMYTPTNIYSHTYTHHIPKLILKPKAYSTETETY